MLAYFNDWLNFAQLSQSLFFNINQKIKCQKN